MPTAKSLIAAPLVCRQISGAIAIGASESNQWNDEDAKTLLAVSKIISIQFEQLLGKVKSTNGKKSFTNGARRDVSSAVGML